MRTPAAVPNKHLVVYCFVNQETELLGLGLALALGLALTSPETWNVGYLQVYTIGTRNVSSRYALKLCEDPEPEKSFARMLIDFYGYGTQVCNYLAHEMGSITRYAYTLLHS